MYMTVATSTPWRIRIIETQAVGIETSCQRYQVKRSDTFTGENKGCNKYREKNPEQGIRTSDVEQGSARPFQLASLHPSVYLGTTKRAVDFTGNLRPSLLARQSPVLNEGRSSKWGYQKNMRTMPRIVKLLRNEGWGHNRQVTPETCKSSRASEWKEAKQAQSCVLRKLESKRKG